MKLENEILKREQENRIKQVQEKERQRREDEMKRKSAVQAYQNMTKKTGKYLDDLRQNLITELRNAAFPTSDKSGWNNAVSGKEAIKNLNSTLIQATIKENQRETELKRLLDKTLLEKEIDKIPESKKPPLPNKS